ncbi:MAG: hypothetical protein NT004_02445 [Bacteroidetes bacterium]|nr:hypothetical protein [Bacteroidota bacterium]
MKTKIILLVILANTIMTYAQKKVDSLPAFNDTVSFIVVKFKEGSKYYGKLKENRNDTLTLIIEDLGPVRIPYSKISRVETLEYMAMKKGKFWFPTPLPGRYFFAPSAFTLNPGEGYYQNTLIALNSFNVGVTKWFSIGGGIEFFTTIVTLTAGDFRPIFYLTPKIGFKVTENVRVGGGFIYAHIMNEAQLGTFYGVFTFGNPDYNFTAGLGWGYTKTKNTLARFQSNPMITLCGTARISRKVAFVTENWFIPFNNSSGFSYSPLFSYGLRFFGESLSFDLAFINNKDIVKALFIGIPFVAITVKF